jgi:5-formyltetrahydrofolate cyclo-ligase
MSESEIKACSGEAQARILKSKKFERAHSVGAYFALGSEVKTDLILDEAVRVGKKVSLPRVEGERIRFYEFSDRQGLIRGRFGIMEPHASSEITDIDLIIVPGIAFDNEGYRLGYGKGFYDRYLSETAAYSIGLAFSFQMTDGICRDGHDRRVNAVATEKSLICFDE